MTKPLSDKQIDRLIADYLAGSLSESDRPAFEDWLRASPEHPRRVARLSVTDYCMHEVCQDTKSDYLLAILNQIDDAAGPAQLVTLHHLNASPWHRYRIHAAWGAIAAALLLGMVLTAVLLTGSDAPVSQEIADNTPPKPAESAQPILRDTHVATLTAQHNATWAEGASAPGSLTPGSKLHPNQTLTLTAGFAEITTTRGAVAILQAPATIEFTNHDNALRLHAGKLVGICETESSKGFLVHTPHMDITDLGTRFGINADADATEVHVFEGKVQAERVDTAPGTEPILLAANQSARTSADTDVITSIDHDADRFAALLPTTIELPGTGFGLKVGDTDPNWQIVAIDGKPLDTPQAVRVSTANGPDVPNDPAAAQWLSWDPGQEPEAGSFITYTFRTRITLPESIDPVTSQIRLRYVADNQVRSIRVNGHSFELDHAPNNGRWIVRTAVLDEHLKRGENVIEFEVANHLFEGLNSAVAVGLHVQWELMQIVAEP